MIKLDILSDPVCPWCLIGKTLLDRALADLAEPPFVIEWHPFQLNPDMPRAGMDRPTYLEAKFGSPEKAVGMLMQITEHATAAGLDIDWSAIPRMPNTLDAHRLIHWAGIESRQNPVVDALFRAYFFEGQDIGDRDTLAAIAGACGLDAAAIRRLLDSDADIDVLRDREAHSRKMGVSGVPTFIVAQHHVLTGAQPTDLWQRVIDEVMAGTPDAATQH
ncbi:MAG: DsbA family oxidoreductase [Qingshengfaniella sp.]